MVRLVKSINISIRGFPVLIFFKYSYRARAQALIEARKAQGLDLPDVGERKPRLGTRVKPNKQKKEQPAEGKYI